MQFFNPIATTTISLTCCPTAPPPPLSSLGVGIDFRGRAPSSWVFLPTPVCTLRTPVWLSWSSDRSGLIAIGDDVMMILAMMVMMMMVMMMMVMSPNTRVHTPHTRVTWGGGGRVALIMALLDQLDCDLDLNLTAGDDDDVPPPVLCTTLCPVSLRWR